MECLIVCALTQDFHLQAVQTFEGGVLKGFGLLKLIIL